MFNKENVNLTINQFNFTCKTFTTVMAIKHRLLRSLFSGTYYFTNSNDNLTTEKGIKNLTLILEYLETLGSILQDIEVCTCILATCYLCSDVTTSHVMLCHYVTTGNICMQAVYSFQFRSVQENILE